jgi:hypothetical protein
MEAAPEERVREDQRPSANPRVLTTLAAAVLVLSAAALAFSSVDAAIGISSARHIYQNGWAVGSMVLMYAGSAIYLPSVLLGLAALTLVQSRTTRERAARIARPLFILGVLVVIVGIGRAICELGSDYYAQIETLGWHDAQTVFGLLGRSLLHAGTLTGLAYLCRRQVGSAAPSSEQA